MKYVLVTHMNPDIWESLSDAEREAVMSGHADFQKVAKEHGELVSALALADPSNSATVRVRDGNTLVKDEPHVPSKEFLAGFYMVDCKDKDRAIELASLIPDARINVIEVRPVQFWAGPEN